MLKTTAAVLGGGYLALAGVARFGYRQVLYPAPKRGMTRAPADGELVRATAADGQPLQLLLLAAEREKGTVVFFHGNGETIADALWLGRELARRGLTFVAVEYRGYGSSPSERPCEEGLYADAEGAIAWLDERGKSPSSLILFGSSLGSGVAVEMAARGHGKRLILATPYTSIPDVARDVMPILPMGWLLDDHYDNLAKAQQVRQATLIFHGDSDQVVPYRMGVTLSEALDNARLITIEGGHHNDLYALAREQLLSAIEEHASA